MAKELEEIRAFEKQRAVTKGRGSVLAEAADFFSRFSALIKEGQEEGYLAPRLPVGSRLVIARADGGSTKRADALLSRSQPIPFEIAIPGVSPEVYAETRRAVETAIPNVFIAQIQPDTMEELLVKDLQREADGGSRRINHGWVNTSKGMRATFPPAMEVFIDPQKFRIDNSNNLSTDAQKAKIAEEAAKLSTRLPKNVSCFVIWQMMDPSTGSQLEDRYMDRYGELLMPDFFIRTDVPTVQGFVADVGHLGPYNQREVNDWHRDFGYHNVFAGLVGVLPQELAA